VLLGYKWTVLERLIAMVSLFCDSQNTVKPNRSFQSNRATERTDPSSRAVDKWIEAIRRARRRAIQRATPATGEETGTSMGKPSGKLPPSVLTGKPSGKPPGVVIVEPGNCWEVSDDGFVYGALSFLYV